MLRPNNSGDICINKRIVGIGYMDGNGKVCATYANFPVFIYLEWRLDDLFVKGEQVAPVMGKSEHCCRVNKVKVQSSKSGQRSGFQRRQLVGHRWHLPTVTCPLLTRILVGPTHPADGTKANQMGSDGNEWHYELQSGKAKMRGKK